MEIKNTKIWIIVKYIKDNYISILHLRLLSLICRFLPLENKVVFDNFNGGKFGDDPKYIALELLKRKDCPTLYWLTKDTGIELPDGIRPIKFKSLSSIYHLATAKVWVDNVKNVYKPRKRKGQFYIQTWHATLSLKMVEEKAPTIPFNYREMAIIDSGKTDLMYSNNDHYKYLYEHTFWYHGNVIKCDVPRMAPIINSSDDIRLKVLHRYGLPSDTKIVLYAPTFRSGYKLEPIMFDYHKICKMLESKFGGSFVMLLRLHPNYARFENQFPYDDTIYNATTYPDMQELLAVADVMINDYSSSMFEFAITKKPLFLLCKDYEDYRSGDRGLEFTLEQLPFSLARTEIELESNIKDFNQEDYNKKVNLFIRQVGIEDKGQGDKIIADIVLNKLH